MKIEIYTTPTCPMCTILKQELADLNPTIINCFEEIDKANELGIKGVPIVIINDTIRLYKPTAEEVKQVIKDWDVEK